MPDSQLPKRKSATGPEDSLFRLPLHPLPPQHQSRFNAASSANTRAADRAYASFSVKKAVHQLETTSEATWLKRGEKRALALFHAAAQHIPAYKQFLSKHGVKPGKIRTMDDFRTLPLMDKENYLRRYPLEDLAWYGDLTSTQMISVSSGSSGQPFFWPRAQLLDTETALEHELFLTTHFGVDKHSTLFLVCFAMGMYVAGPLTMNSILKMGMKGYPVTVATPGYSPDDVLKIIPDLAHRYDQLVLAGYPPYIKEIIDKGIERGINWKKYRIKFLLAGEGFNESWRTYISKLVGGASPITDFINLYGSADAAVLAHETPASIIVRRRIAEDISARQRLFHSERLPSLLQYHPEHKYFEVIDDELIFTAPGGIPLIRYNIHDSGGVLSRRDIVNVLPELGEYFTDLERHHQLWNLPFVYVHGKSDQTVILYGANIYPENIRRALEHEELRDKCTGKLMMYTKLDKDANQRLHIEIECSKGTTKNKNLEDKMFRRILETLLDLNSEFKVTNQGIGERSHPEIKLVSYGHKKFNGGHIKHRWTRKRHKR